MKKLLTSAFLFLLLLLPINSFAQSPSPLLEKVDVNAIFWPVVAGKTVSDPLFFLKQLKENFDGFFKSDLIKKSEYRIELSEKRFVEAAKLIESKDFSNAKKSLDMGILNRNEAINIKKKAQEEKRDVNELALKIVKSLENQQKALVYLKTQFPEKEQGEIEKIISDLTLKISEAR